VAFDKTGWNRQCANGDGDDEGDDEGDDDGVDDGDDDGGGDGDDGGLRSMSCCEEARGGAGAK
jgi:hypothetical protein